MDSISPRKFEELVGAIFRNNGFAVELTSQTRDGGYDLVVAENTDVEGGIALVEVKKYRSDRTVGVDLVRQIYGVKTLQKADKCYLVTSSSVSPYAKREFSRVIPRELEFLEREDVIEWCRRYYASVIKED
jgi:restriction system protein